MATWKKIVVSGSDISQLNNDASYLTEATAQNAIRAFATASFNGTELLADSWKDNLTFASSSGDGLNISADAGSDTLTFSLDAIPNSSLENSTISGKALGTTLDNLTVDNDTLQLNSGTTYNGSAARTISIKDGGVDTAAIADSLGTLGENSFTGSFTGSFVGDGTGLTNISADTLSNSLTDGNGISDFTFDGSSAQTVSVEADGGTLTVGASGVKVSDNGITATQINTSVAGTGLSGGGGTALSVDYGSTSGTAVQGNTTITVNGTTNEIDITGTAAQALGGAPSYTIGLADSIGGDRTFQNNVTITGDLTVNGTTTTLNTNNLNVEDQFIYAASGSSTVDGGLLVQSGSTTGQGSAIYHDATDERWSVAKSVAADATAVTPLQYLVTAKLEASNPTAGQGDYGVGEVWINTSTEEVFIRTA